MLARNKQQALSSNKISTTKGFTIIELLVVLFMMGVLSTLFVANYNATRGPRNLRIAQNELVSNLRKVQGYTLSSRNSPSGNPAHFYVIKFSTITPNQYIVQIIDNTTPATAVTTETILLPQGVTFASNNAFSVQQPIDGAAVSATCVQVGFSLPFSKTYMDKNCTLNTVADSPAQLDVLKNSLLTITLFNASTNTTRQVLVNAVTGAITPQ